MQDRPVPYFMGSDQVIEEEISRFGLHRRHLIHRHGVIDCEAQMQGVPKDAHCVHSWIWTDTAGTGHQVIVWKENR